MGALVALSAAFSLALWGAVLAASPDSFKECFAALREDPLGREPAECFQSADASRSETEAALEEAVAQYPRSGWLHFILGSILWDEETPAHYDRALHAFQETDDQQGLYLTHLNYALNLVVRRRLGAAEHIEAIRKDVGSSPLERARFHYLVSANRFVEGDLDSAAYAIAQAQETLPEGAPDRLRVQFLNHGARVYRELDLPRQALRATQEALDIHEGRSSTNGGRRLLSSLASSAYDVAIIRKSAYPPSPRQRAALVADLEKALAWAIESENRDIEVKALRVLADTQRDERSWERLRRCLNLSRQYKRRDDERRCLLTWASLVVEDDSERALELVGQANAIESALSEVGPVLDGWRVRMQILWKTRPPSEALQASLPFLDAVEALRRNQSSSVRDRVLSNYSHAYYWIAGRLLKEESLPEREALALSIMERLRAQSLRERLLRPSAQRAAMANDDQLIQLGGDLEQGFKSLLDPALDARQRVELTARLDETKHKLDERRQALGLDDPPDLAPPPTDLLPRVQQALAPNEALLSFQIGLERGYDGQFSGGAWLLTVTRGGLKSFPLTWDQARMEGALEMILDAPHERQDEFFFTLYRELLDPALSELPAHIEELILVLDGGLHRVPFARLRMSAGEPFLIERFQLTLAPSAALLVQWRERTAQGGQTPLRDDGSGVLVFADPQLPGSAQADDRRGFGSQAVALGSLPFARREGKRILARVAGRGQLLAGEEATESRLKESAGDDYQVLHLAAHAVVDENRPWRSAVLLAPGEDDDGWLRPEEISALDGLRDQLVVLAACQGASGEILRGEGVLSLARSFFAGGARSVIGSLEPLDDRQSMHFFDSFYRHLAKGASVGGALAKTQREWRSQNPQDPTWSSIVLLGEPAWTPFPGGIPSTRPTGLQLAGLTAAVLLVAALLTLLYLRGRRGSQMSSAS